MHIAYTRVIYAKIAVESLPGKGEEPLQEHIQAIVTLLSLVNPIICAMMFVQAETGRSRSAQLIDATKAVLAVTVILLFFALLGTQLLHQFGVSLNAFMVAGGGVLAWMGFGILSGQQATPSSPAADANTDTSLTPLILFAASPGTITGVITIAAAHTQLNLPVSALVAIGVAAAVMWSTLLLSIRLSGKQDSAGFVRSIITRFMGLIVLSMGIQFALTGYRAFMG
jgi:multiple antibiotic resistance protein